MKAILTLKGAKRIRRLDLANKEVEITNLRTMPWGSRNATIIVDGHILARSMHVYTPGHDKDHALKIIGEK